MRRRLVGILGGLVLALVGCQQSTTDPDQAVRDLIVAHTWITDDTQTNTESMLLTLKSDGTGLMSQWQVTWSYAGGTFKMTRTSDSASWSTSSPKITSSTFVITWENGLVHLVASSG